MSQEIREYLSAAIDGELSGEELRFLLRRLDHDASLQQAWANYHVAGDGLRRKLPPMAGNGFADRVMHAVERESAIATPKRSHWLRWSAGGAIAASVAAAALMIGQPTSDVDRTPALAARPASAVASFASTGSKSTMPAAVPPWLSGNSAGLLSQQASFGTSSDSGQLGGAGGLSPVYPLPHRYRTLDNHDGSYLLLLDPQQQQYVPDTVRQAAAALH